MFVILFTSISIVGSLLITYFCKMSYWLVIPIFLGLWLLSVLMLVIFCFILSLTVKDGSTKTPKRIFSSVTYHICELVVWFFRVKIVSQGMEKIKDKKILLVCNHQSLLDPLIWIKCVGINDLTFIMKESILKIPVVGKWLLASGFFPLNRENNRKGLETIINSIKRVEAGYPVGVFPEGTRCKEREMGPFHEGAFKIATRSKAPIVVCIIDNSDRIIRKFPFKRTKVLVKVCEVLNCDDIKDLNTHEISEKVMSIMKENLSDAYNTYYWLK